MTIGGVPKTPSVLGHSKWIHLPLREKLHSGSIEPKPENDSRSHRDRMPILALNSRLVVETMTGIDPIVNSHPLANTRDDSKLPSWSLSSKTTTASVPFWSALAGNGYCVDWVIHSRPIESKAMFICFTIVGSAEKQFTHSAVEKTQNQSTRSLRAFMAESNLGFGRDKGVWKGR